jgi:GNAT superfamily N-acetyltransferase
MVPREYFATMGTTIDRLLDRADTRALVADTADRIVGWLVWTPIPGAPVLHYVYVRASERRHGVARALADRAGLDTSSPVVYLFGGPDRRWLLQKAPRSVSMSADNFLSG